MLPLATTTITSRRWSLLTPGTLATLLVSVPAVVGSVSGNQRSYFAGQAPSGWQEDVSANLRVNPADLDSGDIVTDNGTGKAYRVLWAEPRQGLGLDHVAAVLSSYSPTGSYSCSRGLTEDAFGDENPSGAAIWTAMPGEIREVSRNVRTPATEAPGTSRAYMGRFPPGTDIKPRDRITDLTTGVVFVVTSTADATWPGLTDVGVELTRQTQ